jgi:hypothetical protein
MREWALKLSSAAKNISYALERFCPRSWSSFRKKKKNKRPRGRAVGLKKEGWVGGEVLVCPLIFYLPTNRPALITWLPSNSTSQG